MSNLAAPLTAHPLTSLLDALSAPDEQRGSRAWRLDVLDHDEIRTLVFAELFAAQPFRFPDASHLRLEAKLARALDAAHTELDTLRVRLASHQRDGGAL